MGGVEGGEEEEEEEEWPVLVTRVESLVALWEEEGHGSAHSLYVLFSDVF